MSSSAGLYEQLKDDLGYLQWNTAAERFAVLAEEATAEGWSHVEYLARVVGEQAGDTRDRRLAARLRYARFPFRRSIGDFDFEFQPSVDPKLVEDLASLRFIDENRPILFLGQPGCGKTHLAVALAIKAVEAGYRGYFTTADEMCRNLVAAMVDGTFRSKLRTYTAPTVLVIDDWVCYRSSRHGPPRRSSTSSTNDLTKVTPPLSPPTEASPTGEAYSVTPSSPPPSWTGSSTGPSCSTSEDPHGGSESTKPSPPPPPIQIGDRLNQPRRTLIPARDLQ